MSETEKKKATTKKAAKKKTVKKAAVKKAAVKKKSVKKAAVKKKAAAKKTSKTAGLNITAEERWKMIAVAAYHREEKRNFAPGNEIGDWAEAEKEIEKLLNG